MKKELIKYFKSLGIEVYTNTKARGHQGFFLNSTDKVSRFGKLSGSLCRGRIDISKNTKEERIIPTLLHEFAHFIHNKIEPNMNKTGGSLEVLFDLKKQDLSLRANEMSEAIQERSFFRLPCRFAPRNDINGCSKEQKNHSTIGLFDLSTIQKELMQVTKFVDDNSHCQKLKVHKEQVKKNIKMLEAEILKDYPKFMRSKKFKEFDKYIKKSKARYLLRYDRVKFVSPKFFGIMREIEVFAIDNLERDFPEMPRAFCAYIRLKSAQRKQARISARMNRLNKYYSKPTELFARLVEGIYINETRVHALAPHVTQRFFELLGQGHYFELKNVLEMLQEEKNLAII